VIIMNDVKPEPVKETPKTEVAKPVVKPEEKKTEVVKPVVKPTPKQQASEKVKENQTPVNDKPAPKPSVPKSTGPDLKMFGRWSYEGIVINDPGLKGYISLKPQVVPRSAGRQSGKQFYKSKCSLVERLMNHLAVAGHRGRRHLVSSGKNTGKAATLMKVMKKTLELLEQRSKKNPLAVLVGAIENSALREEVTSFQVGGVVARKAVISSPQRRIDLAMRLIAQTSYHRSKKNPKGIAGCLADELLAAYQNDSNKSVAIKTKERIEREAAGAR
jgi:small subunit ribosomal protein S7